MAKYPIASSRLPVLKIGSAIETLAGTVDTNAASLARGYVSGVTHRLFGIDFSVDTGLKDLTGDTMVGAIRGRTVIGTSQSNASIYAMMAEMDTGTVTFTGGNYGALYASYDMYGTNSMSGATHTGAVFATVWNEATTTVGSGVTEAGIHLVQNTAPTISSGGLNPAILIRGNSWQHAIYIVAEAQLATSAIIKFSGEIVGAVQVASESPLVDISATANAGYIRVDVGTDVRYIALYAAKTS